MKTKLPEERVRQIQLLRQMLREPTEPWTGKLKDAKEKAREACDRVGIKTFVIRRKRKYDYVFEPYFDTYTYKGKIYAEYTPNLDAEI